MSHRPDEGGGRAPEATGGERLFAYGTLRDPARMTRLLGATPPRLPARITGWRCEGVRGEAFPGIAPHPDASVDGDLYLALDPRALAQLDVYEGPLYQRIRIVAEVGDDHSMEAWVYALRPEHRGRLDGRSWPQG